MTETRRSIDERFYRELMPAVYRTRDDALGQPLRALLAILEHEFQAVLDDTTALYDDWFIETCKEWVTPYLGDLLGAAPLRSVDAEGFTQRAYVANTLAYRRRKGTAFVLEQLARDVTGWPARAVEYFERLATTQHLQHLGRGALVTASLRRAERLELAQGPLGEECHTADVRSITARRGRFNIPNVGVHLWRLRPYAVRRVEARALGAGRYTFDPRGTSGPLFNLPRAEGDITHLAEERDLPVPLRRRALHAELAAGAPFPEDGWFGAQPVLRVVRGDADHEAEIGPASLRICNLDLADGADWPRPGSEHTAYVDPEMGRLSLLPSAIQSAPEHVLVDYVYAFSADVGGGPYDRRQTVPERLDVTPGADTPDDTDGERRAISFQEGVTQEEARVGHERLHQKLSRAIDAWNRDALLAWHRRRPLERLICVMDSRTYRGELTLGSGRCVVVPPGCTLRLVAARWPVEAVAGVPLRRQGRLDPSGVRPHLLGDIEVLGLTDATGEIDGGRLEIDGLLIEGRLSVLPGGLGALALRHSTLVPGHGGLRVARSPHLELEITRSIVDGVSVAGQAGSLRIAESILDTGARLLEATTSASETLLDTPLAQALGVVDGSGTSPDAAALRDELAATPVVREPWTTAGAAGSLWASGSDARIERSTVLGRVDVRTVYGSECLFVEPLRVQLVQEDCLRYCYAPPASRTPRRFRCQPDLALAALEAAGAAGARRAAEAAGVRARLRPGFTSTRYGHPGYCQLTPATPRELATGSEAGCELGVFGLLQQAHRESNLGAALEQYLRFGLDAGWFFVT